MKEYYGGPQLSHQNKMRTSNSNHSHQIQITHSKFKSLTANYKSPTANYKSFTSNTNRSHQIQIVHIKYKSLTASTHRVSVKGGLQTSDCRLRTRGKSKLRVKCKLQTKGKIQNGDRRLGVKSADCRPGEKMREKTAGNTSALVEVRRNP